MIEQRLTHAILDLESLLAEDRPVDAALCEAAKIYGLKVAVLAERAAKALGPLGDVKARTDARVAAARSINVSRAAVSAFAEADPAEPVHEWLSRELGRPATHDEQRDALALSIERWLKANAHQFREG